MRSALWLLALASCSESSANSVKDPFAKPPPVAALSVEIGAVTLADDCAPKDAPAGMVPEEAAPPSTPAAPARRAPGYRGHCDQTTMQLMIKTPASFKAGTVKIKKVELLDADGKLLQTLAARNPRAWKNTTSYLPWDEKVGPSAGINSMYDLASPDWNTLTKGRWNAHSKKFQVRVVVEIGNASKTVTRQAITAARLPPPVPT